MLKIVNEELMSYSTIDVIANGQEFTKIKVATSNKLQQYENDSRDNRANGKNTDNRKPNNNMKGSSKVNIVSNVEQLKPINREIIRISAPLKNIGDFIAQPSESKTVDFDLPMTVNVSSNGRQQNVEVRCHEQGDDKANVFVIAFPFNGMIKPIPQNPQYRIYKGLIASSAKPFFFNNRKYRKVLYLIVEFNKNLFNPEHKYHTDEIAIQFDSYSLFTDKESNAQKTTCETFLLRIFSENGDYATHWEYNVADEAIMMTAEPGQNLWTTFDVNAVKNSRNAAQKSAKPEYTTKKPNKQKQVVVEGDMMVTTNKHGIRKEIPIKQGNQKNRNNNSRSNDIDQMMKDSGMFDSAYDNRGKRNGGKRSGSYRGNRGDRY